VGAPPVGPHELTEAESAVWEAEEVLRETSRDNTAAVRAAQRSLDHARERLEARRSEFLSPFPVAEVVLTPAVPAVVAEVAGRTGSVVDGLAVRLTAGSDLVALVSVPRDVARRLEVGTPAEVRPEAGAIVAGTVSWVADRVGPAAVLERHGEDGATGARRYHRSLDHLEVALDLTDLWIGLAGGYTQPRHRSIFMLARIHGAFILPVDQSRKGSRVLAGVSSASPI
jgi:hypothetical protein